MFRLSSLLRTKSGAFKARKAIPVAVRSAYQRLYGRGWEVIFSLPAGTSLSVAKTKHAEWLALIERRIATLAVPAVTNAPALTMQQADALAEDWYGQFVAAREAEPGDAVGWADALSNAEAVLAGDEDFPDDILADADRFLTDRGARLSPASMEKFHVALAREYRAAAATLIRRSEGDRGRDAHLDHLEPQRNDGYAITANGPVVVLPVSSRRPVGSAVSAAALLAAYAADRGVAPSTLRRWEPVMAALDTQPWQKPQWDAQAWIDSLAGNGRGKSTVKRTWLAACRTVLRWAVKRKRIAVSPFADVEVSVPRKIITRETGRGFTDAEISTILQAAAKTTVRDERSASRRWMPWLMAYTGARAGEVAQLRAGDVDLTRKALTFTPSAGTVKTGQARTVPIHEHLVEQGFLRFVKGVLALKGQEGGLFYAGRNDAGKILRSDGVANKLSKWVRSLGITDPGISPNHAWRHTWRVRARRAKIEQGVRNAIEGHSSSSMDQHYDHVTVEDMAEALKQFPPYTVATTSA
jgi:integrase